MALPVYSIRIFAHASLAASAGIVGPVVRAGFVYVLRDIDVYENNVTNNASLFVLNAMGGALNEFRRGATGTPGVWQWTGRQVYNVGEQIGFEVAGGVWAIQASGYQLSLP